MRPSRTSGYTRATDSRSFEGQLTVEWLAVAHQRLNCPTDVRVEARDVSLELEKHACDFIWISSLHTVDERLQVSGVHAHAFNRDRFTAAHIRQLQLIATFHRPQAFQVSED